MTRKAKIIVWSIITCMVLIMTVVLFLFPGLFSNKSAIFSLTNYKYDQADSYIAGNAQYATNGIRDLDIDWISGNVKLEFYDGEMIDILESSQSTLTAEMQLHSAVIGNKLKIKFAKSGSEAPVINTPKNLIVKIPKGFNLQSLSIDTVSASVASDLVCTIPDTEIDTVSGNVTITGLSGTKLEVDTVSGEVTVAECFFPQITLDSVSGNISYTPVSAKGLISFKADTASGNLTLNLPEDAGFEAKLSTVSGDFISQFACTQNKKTYTCGNGEYKIELDSTSGDLIINKR